MPANSRAWIAALALATSLVGTLQADYRDAFRKGYQAYVARNWTEAIAQFRAALAEQPRDSDESIDVGGAKQLYRPRYHLILALYERGACADVRTERIAAEKDRALRQADAMTVLAVERKCAEQSSGAMTPPATSLPPPAPAPKEVPPKSGTTKPPASKTSPPPEAKPPAPATSKPAEVPKPAATDPTRPGSGAPRPSPTPTPTPSTTTLERFPVIDAPSPVAPGRRFPLQVSLSETIVSAETRVNSGATTAAGALQLNLPGASRPWQIDLILSAPGFDLEGEGVGAIALPPKGDSTTALFYLTARDDAQLGARRPVYVTLWHGGAFLAKISRDVTVGVPGTAERQTMTVQRPRSASIAPAVAAPDLTIWENPQANEVIIESPYLQPHRGTVMTPPDLAAWLDANFNRFSAASVRSSRGGGGDEPPAGTREERIALLQGFGQELYRKVAPAALREAFWRLKDLRGDAFRTIQIFSTNPAIPWELMRPTRPDGSGAGEFLGVEFNIARWHVTSDTTQFDRPPQKLDVGELALVAPQYTGDLALPNQKVEVDALRGFPGYRTVTPTISGVTEAFARARGGGIVHFSGHGAVVDGASASARYVVRLQDGDLDALTWQGLTSGRLTGHPLVFMNACETGQARGTANFVDGWAPRLLEAGASGYVGGLWPLGDRGAAEFAVRFYRQLAEELKAGPVTVGDLLRTTRARFYDAGDPTFLAYAYYGDPRFEVVFARR